jgi:hypothetical protein
MVLKEGGGGGGVPACVGEHERAQRGGAVDAGQQTELEGGGEEGAGGEGGHRWAAVTVSCAWWR